MISVQDRVLVKAIELKCSQFYGAMSAANAISGSASAEWAVARANKLVDLVADAIARKIEFGNSRTAVDGVATAKSGPFEEAVAKISALTDRGASFDVKSGWKLDGVFLGNDVSTAIESIG